MSIFLSSVPILLCGVGLYFLLRLRGFYLLHPVRTWRAMTARRRTGGISPFRALTVALAGTLGVGNIVGVASALYYGGPGAILWMVVSALVAMVLKYAEITLAVRHRRTPPSTHTHISPPTPTSDHIAPPASADTPYPPPPREAVPPVGGASYYMQDLLTARKHPRAGRVLGAVFSLLCLCNAVSMGGMLQVNAAAGAMEAGFGVPPLLTGGVLALLCLAVIMGGAKRLSALTEALIPLLTVGFLVVSTAVLILRRERLADAFLSIGRDALSPLTAGAGIGGFLLSRGLRFGVMRGLVSNEAGCGTAPMAHVAADTDCPARQGLFGLAEVFVDTVLLCTVTALVILVSDSGPTAFGADVTRTAQAAFASVLGPWAGGFFALSILLFAAATVLCWAHYGVTCVEYLAGLRKGKHFYPSTCRKASSAILPLKQTAATTPGAPRRATPTETPPPKTTLVALPRLARNAFLLLYAASLLWGALTAPRLVWTLSDLAIGSMTFLNLALLLLGHREIESETRHLFPHK